MGRKKNIRIALLYFVCSVLILIGLESSVSKAEGFYENGFLSFSPDHGAWTVREELPRVDDAENRINPSCWYGWNEVILTEKTSSNEEPEAWEHFYRYNRKGLVPIWKWTLAHREGRCIHKEQFPFHNLDYTSFCCGASYYSGWNAYCADCGEKVLDFNVYISKSKIARITEVDTSLDYYYLCPTCKHLEQGRGVHHICRAISANRYRVQYLPNGGNVAGFMQSSFHMYNNEEWFEGENVTPVKKLNKNTFSREGYLFTGWNTESDGSGLGFADEQEIWNLTADNYDPDSNKGTVSLYAQWKKVSGILEIDPAGGSYLGLDEISTVSVGYDQEYQLKPSYITPPQGYLVSFEVRGGKALEDQRELRSFCGWSLQSPSNGSLEGNSYRFWGDEGAKDRVSALYTSEGIWLPLPYKEGFSFGGWYYDNENTRLAGGAGDRFMPQGDQTLYACWVELVLQADLNLLEHGGKGAVDLHWQQPDGNRKAYLLYQKREGEDFHRIYEAQDKGAEEEPGTEEILQSMSYPVTQSGFYQLVVRGAQGQDWEEWQGGLGGYAEGIFYLKKNDLLSVNVGAREGERAGGRGEEYGGGGGKTEIISKELGTLLTAGGGGGAGPLGNGGAGGTEEGLRADGKAQGEDGLMGGGAGWIGGKAGIYLKHIHSRECLHVHVGSEISGGDCYELISEEKKCHVKVSGPYVERSLSDNCDDCIRAGRNGYNSMHPRCWWVEHSGCGQGKEMGHSGYWVCDTCGRIGYCWGSGKEKPNVSDHNYHVKKYILTCTKEYDCGNPVGRFLNSYGGSNYINKECVVSYSSVCGVGVGDGYASVQPINVGFREEMELLGAYAPDLAAPKQIDPSSVRIEALGDGTIVVLFQRPTDCGTDYYHQVHSYPAGKEEILSSSNITLTEVVTGIAGYYYLLDENEKKDLSIYEGKELTLCREEKIVLSYPEGRTYLHVAPVDGAGNIGGSIAIELSDNTVVNWKLVTDPITVDSVIAGIDYENVVPAEGMENTYYVKADGRTPFLLSFRGRMLGSARPDYQINRMNFEFSTGEGAAKGCYTVLLPLGSTGEAEQEMPGETLGYQTGGLGILQAGMYGRASRENWMRDAWIAHSFCLDINFHKKRIYVFPTVEAVTEEGHGLSEREEDERNGITLIGDGAAPIVLGLEEADRLLRLRGETVRIDLEAKDTESGVAEFEAILKNLDNGEEAVYHSGTDGKISILLEEESPIFIGDLQLTIRAVDKVGNEASVQCGAEDFGVKAEVIRVLAPHTPLFKRGESGMLIVKARGYVERIEVELPDILAEGGKYYEFCYSTPKDLVREELLFMVPLSVDVDGEYSILVKAYKGEGVLADEPRLCTLKVEDTVLGELRTRLR